MSISLNEFKYSGSELDLFAAVRNWKSYWSGQVRPFITGSVLEVGAGIGSNTQFLDPGDTGRWLCLEPDPQLAERLKQRLTEIKTRRAYEAACGTVQSLGAEQFETILYIDVLEHIENDREELNAAALHLRPGGHIIVLAPAHQALFTPFDTAIGHYRRYNRRSLLAIAPEGLHLKQMRYLDCCGLLASAANLLLLRQSLPTEAQLQFWDHWLVPASRVLDKAILYSLGKSILAIWRRP